MENNEQLLNPNKTGERKTRQRYHKSTKLIDVVLVICRDPLCSKEINNKKLDLTSELWVFSIFQQGLAPF